MIQLTRRRHHCRHHEGIALVCLGFDVLFNPVGRDKGNNCGQPLLELNSEGCHPRICLIDLFASQLDLIVC